MKIGFTGTQVGMRGAPVVRLEAVLKDHLPVDEFHHGDCVGADDTAHDVAVAYSTVIVIHPPIVGAKRARRGGRIRGSPSPTLPVTTTSSTRRTS